MTLETLLLLSFVAGLVGAMAGMGGGVVLIPALTLVGEDIKHAIALLDTGLAAPVIVGVTAGAFAGTRVLLRSSNENVHRGSSASSCWCSAPR